MVFVMFQAALFILVVTNSVPAHVLKPISITASLVYAGMLVRRGGEGKAKKVRIPQDPPESGRVRDDSLKKNRGLGPLRRVQDEETTFRRQRRDDLRLPPE
jgi:hypothetical protein